MLKGTHTQHVRLARSMLKGTHTQHVRLARSMLKGTHTQQRVRLARSILLHGSCVHHSDDSTGGSAACWLCGMMDRKHRQTRGTHTAEGRICSLAGLSSTVYSTPKIGLVLYNCAA